MTINEYSKQALTTRLPAAESLSYALPAVVDEVGEIAKIFKKAIRDDGWDGVGPLSEHRTRLLLFEAGDLIWELNNMLALAGLNLERVMTANLEKLLDRQQRGVLGGSGDNR